MAKKYWAVKWGETTRWAQAADEKDACLYAFGLYTKDMMVKQWPSNPKYLSRKKKDEFLKSLESAKFSNHAEMDKKTLALTYLKMMYGDTYKVFTAGDKTWLIWDCPKCPERLNVRCLNTLEDRGDASAIMDDLVATHLQNAHED